MPNIPDINQHEYDIQNLKEQNENDFAKDKLQAKQIEEIKKELELIKIKYSALIKNLQTQIKNIQINGGEGIVSTIEIIDNLLSSSKTAGLSANQGRVIKQLIDNINSNLYTIENTVNSIDVPTKTSQLTNDSDYVNSSYVTNAINNASLGGSGSSVDLSIYATKTELDSKANISDVPTKTSQLTNDSDYVNSDYVTNAINNASLGGSGSSVDLSIYATKTELNSKANISDIPTKISQLTNDNNYVTLTQMNTALENAGVTPDEGTSNLIHIIVPETITINSGGSTDITLTLDKNVTSLTSFKLGSNTNMLTFSGSDLFNGQPIIQFSSTVKSRTITITANNTDRDLVDFLYYGRYHTGDNTIALTKTKVIIKANSDITNIPVTGISLNVSEYSLEVGGTTSLAPTITPSNATNKNVTWSVNNANCTVDNGLVTAKEIGTSIVTVKTEDGEFTATCTITVAEASGTTNYGNIVISPTSGTVNEGTTTSFTVKLDKAPTNNQIVNINTISNPDVTSNVNSLTFTPSNYNVAQTVTLTIASDTDTSNDTCDITLTSDNVPSVIYSLSITDTTETTEPIVPSGEVVTEGLQVYLDGRDVEAGSKQAYWTNRVTNNDLSTVPITNQFGTINSGWNDTTKTYGWLGDSFRYYLVGGKQGLCAIPNFSETTEFTVEFGVLQEAQEMLDANNTAFHIENSSSSNVTYLDVVPVKDGTLKVGYSVNHNSKHEIAIVETPTIKHLSMDFNSDGTVTLYDSNVLISTLNPVNGYPPVFPYDKFVIATGNYTSNTRVYYLRIYNRKLTEQERTNNFNYENSIVRSVN